jgi:integrase
MLSDTIRNDRRNDFTKSKTHGLYRYNPTGQYFARIRFRGRLYRKKLETDDYSLARRKLADFRRDLERTDATKGNASLAKVLDDYAATLAGAPSTLKDKRAIVAKLKATFFGADTLPLRTIKPTAVAAWLSKHYGGKSASFYNSALTVIRDALDLAVKDKIIIESPAKDLTYHRRDKPIRLTPTFEQFNAIVADVRGQARNQVAEQSGDFIEFIGLGGLGQAEARALTRGDVDLDAGRMIAFRHKTRQGFAVPIFPQLQELVEKLCKGKAHNERLFKQRDAEKALQGACNRLGFPSFTHRSLRRMFITRAIERGIDVKTIADWQGHRDGGKLILQTYSHVRPEHSNRMAQLMTTEEPENVVPMMAEASQKISLG